MDAALAGVALTHAHRALDRAAALLAQARNSDRAGALLAARLAPGMIDCAGQLRTVAGFALRAVLPLAGQAVPALPEAPDKAITQAAAVLRAIPPADFAGAAGRTIRHRAGFADLEQGAADYLHLFAIPNLWFHLSMAYAILRAEGLDIGKSDFDGMHAYPAGFRF